MQSVVRGLNRAKPENNFQLSDVCIETAAAIGMPKPRPSIDPEIPFHITARCINREWFAIPLEEVWTIFENQLFMLNHGFQIKIHSFVLMQNHFHMIARSPNCNLAEAMNYFMRETSREIGRKAGRINQVFGARYHRSALSSHHYFLHAYKYVYRNPVEAGLVKKAEDYKFSTLSVLLGGRRCVIPLAEDTILFDAVTSSLNWINQATPYENRISVKKALRRPIFELPKTIRTQRRNLLEQINY